MITMISRGPRYHPWALSKETHPTASTRQWCQDTNVFVGSLQRAPDPHTREPTMSPPKFIVATTPAPSRGKACIDWERLVQEPHPYAINTPWSPDQHYHSEGS